MSSLILYVHETIFDATVVQLNDKFQVGSVIETVSHFFIL